MSLRTRTRNVSTIPRIWKIDQYFSGQLQQSSYVYNDQQQPGWTSMQDWNNGKVPNPPDSPCFHMRMHMVNGAASIYNVKMNAAGTVTENQTIAGPYPTWVPEDMRATDSLEFRDAVRNALAVFSDSMKSQVKLANFLSESRQITRATSFLKEKRLYKKAAGGNLSYNFGVKPFVGDIQKISKIVKGLENRMQWYLRNAGRVVRIHSGKDLHDPPAQDPPLDLQSTSTVTGTYVNGFSRKFTAFAKVSVGYPGLGPVALRAAYLAEAFGLTRPVAAIWEAIPFSFLADWVLNVDSLADAVHIPVWPVLLTVRSSGYSVKTSCEYEHRRAPRPKYGNTSHSLGTYQITSYERYRRLPAVHAEWESNFSIPTFKQLGLAGSLILTRK